MSKKKGKEVEKQEEVVTKIVDDTGKAKEVPKEDDFMERAQLAQQELVPILEKHEVLIVGQLNDFDKNGITAKAVFADNKNYDK